MKIKNTPPRSAYLWVRLMWAVTAIILAAGGFSALICPSKELVSSAHLLGFIMLAAGMLNFGICEGKGRKLHGAHWLIADGLCATFLSLFPLFNKITEPVILAFFFGTWELVSGILKLMDSSELRREGLNCWSGFTFIGMIELVSGTASMIEPFDNFVGINRVVAVIFFVQACGFFLKSVMAKYIITK